MGVFKDDSPTPITKLGPTCYFGELALLRNDKRAATVKCLTDVTVLSLNRAGFDELLGPLQQIMQNQAAAYDAVTSNKLGSQVNRQRLQSPVYACGMQEQVWDFLFIDRMQVYESYRFL